MVLDALTDAGLTGPDQQLPPSVHVKHGIGRDGRSLHYYLNYSSQSAMLRYTYPAGTDLLTGNAFAPGQQATVAPWDLIIVQESSK
jgi:beta-galactosidase